MTIYRLYGPTYSAYMLENLSKDFHEMYAQLYQELLSVPPENRGTWQSQSIAGSALHETHELLNVSFQLAIGRDDPRYALASLLDADVPWAEDHFQERVGHEPINPGTEWANWPYHNGQPDLHRKGQGQFDHNYMERYWPKFAGSDPVTEPMPDREPHRGIRFPYGDLTDVVNQLKNNPGTRQAYLPVFFPEDTGATEGQRVPCSLGYHFMIRDHVLFLQYTLRSCDIYRHFLNDVYLTLRLGQWVAQQLPNPVDTIALTTHIANLHLFAGDRPSMAARMESW